MPVPDFDDLTALFVERLSGFEMDSAMPAPAPPSLEGLVVMEDGVPNWWAKGANILLMPPGAPPPAFLTVEGDEARDAVVALAGPTPPARVMVWGERPAVSIGPQCRFPHGQLYCGAGSTIVVGEYTGCTSSGALDSRNGGMIHVARGGLWGSNVRLQTDDLHAIRDLSGRRVNAFGGRIRIDEHVWLGADVLVLGGARVERDVVVGAKALVKGRLKANSVYGGVPARLIREGVTWDIQDLP